MATIDSIEVLNQDDGIEILSTFAVNNTLVPVFGSGMTVGAMTKSGTKVPDGSGATHLMKEVLNRGHAAIDMEEMIDWSFSNTAKEFFKEASEDEKNKFFYKYFCNVDLNDWRKDFINIGWHHAYTLNIDDGIERCSDFHPVIPFVQLTKHEYRLRQLYKLHGDAASKITYNDIPVIFNDEQYIHAITSRENKTIYDAFIADYTQNNIVYCGCSLRYEPDLKLYISKIRQNLMTNTVRSIIIDWEPQNNDKRNFVDYGINKIISVNNYRIFYLEFCNEFKRKKATLQNKDYRLINPTIEINSKSDFAIKYIMNNVDFDEESVSFKISSVNVRRTAIKKIDSILKNKYSVIIKGRRFSGKTSLISEICSYYKTKKIYYFPSKSQIDVYLIEQLMNTTNDTLFIFDSNSISVDCHYYLSHAITRLRITNNTIILAVNSSDNYILNNLNSEIIELSPKFDKKELKYVNKKLDHLGIIRRDLNETNIDFAKKVINQYDDICKNSPFLVKKFSYKEQIILIMLAALDKVYYSDITILGIKFTEIDQLISAFQGIVVEKIPTDPEELDRNSNMKLVHNSKYILLDILATIDDETICNCIYHIVNAFKGDYKRERLYIDVILFDTLNQLFPKNGSNGAGKLIPNVYDKIKPLLEDDPDYWLQRGKALYRLYDDDLEKINTSKNYLIKAYNDSAEEQKPKVALSLCIVYNMLIDFNESYTSETHEHVELARSDIKKMKNKMVEYAFEAVNSNYYNNNKNIFKNDFLRRKRKNNTLCAVFYQCQSYLPMIDPHTGLYHKVEYVCKCLGELA